jgi:ESF2/ABP1 family protein
VTRIYLAEEDTSIRQRRKTNGGNASKQFTEGWIEFADKKVAKQVAESLNNTPIGGPKSHYYHDDIWNLKYLKHFKWDFLTEKFSYERRVREAKLKAAMMQAKRNNAEFVELVEKSKQQKHIEERKRKRTQPSDAREKPTTDAPETVVKRKFRQVSAIAVKQGENVNKVDKKLLSNVFAKKNDD